MGHGNDPRSPFVRPAGDDAGYGDPDDDALPSGYSDLDQDGGVLSPEKGSGLEPQPGREEDTFARVRVACRHAVCPAAHCT